MVSAITAVPRPAAGSGVEEFLKYGRELVQTGQYEYLGRCKRIVLEAEAGARTQAPGVTAKIGHVLEWYDTAHPKGGTIRNYMPIGQSPDRRMLLCLEPLLKRGLDGRLIPGDVGLPDMPNPAWKPRNWTEQEVLDGTAANGQNPDMVPQNLNQLTDKMIRGSEILVFQPVVQVLFQPEINQQLQATYWTLRLDYEQATNTFPAFLVDRKTGFAAFYGGKHQIVPVG